MFYIGSLRDKKIAESIVERLSGMDIEANIQFSEQQYNLFIFHEKDADKALDVYRVSLGLPPLKFEIPQQWKNVRKIPMGNFTLNMLIICVGLYLLSFTNYWEEILSILLMGSPEDKWALERILSGEGWRMITPIFLHFNFMHILFNMLWLKDLGKIIEHEKGAIFFFFFVLVTGALSNILQGLINGPMFGGMSGVVYGMLGLLWGEKTFARASQFELPKEDIVLMIGWYILCMTGLFGPIANVAHGVGLGVGMLWSLVLFRKEGMEKLPKMIGFAAAALALAAGSIGVEILKQAS